jgi:predicted nucleic acid-binding protein
MGRERDRGRIGAGPQAPRRRDRPHRFATAKRRLANLESAWHEVAQYDAVRSRARRLLEAHPLRAADALQLGAALVVVEDRSEGVELVTFDERLADAAEKEGFTVRGPRN